MLIVELILISFSLSADAFSVSLCKGLKMEKFNLKHALITAGFFGFFQALMPVIGWLLGMQFISYIEKYDHIIAFVLLAFIGVKMIIDAVKEKDKDEDDDKEEEKLDIKELFVMAIATSIDALAVGITFSFESDLNIFFAAAVIGVITFAVCVAGVFIGNRFGAKFRSKAAIIGGAVLILLGIKILIEGILAL